MSIRTQIFGGGPTHRLLREKQPKSEANFKALTDIAIPREETRRTDARDGDRYRLVGAQFSITHNGRQHTAKLINLSGGGAMVAGAIMPNIGEQIHLHLGENATVECAVRWVKDGRLGLEFAHETKLDCSDDDRSALLRSVIGRDYPEQAFVPRPAAEPQVPEAEENDAVDEQRSATRHPLIWLGALRYGSHTWDVRLRNISSTGTLIECPGYVPVGCEVTLDLDEAGTVEASVSWSFSDHLGLAFNEPFEIRRLSQKKPVITPATWVRPSYLEAHTAPNSAWDECWNRSSLGDLQIHLEGYLKR
jgi:hypothetical protein